MSLTIPDPTTLSDAARAELAAAAAVLERSSLAVRLAGIVGSSVDALRRNLPASVGGMLDEAVKRALDTALRTALASEPQRSFGPLPERWVHRALLAASGIAGGAFGLPGTLLELPVSTAILLRQIATIAAEQGENLSDPLAQAECLQVFALGGRDPADDDVESGYFALRLALAETLKGAVGRSLGQLVPGVVAAVAARFGLPVAIKLSAQAAPVIGAAAGAAVNLAFREHFAAIATAHFTVRRLERRYGPGPVRSAYEAARPF